MTDRELKRNARIKAAMFGHHLGRFEVVVGEMVDYWRASCHKCGATVSIVGEVSEGKALVENCLR